VVTSVNGAGPQADDDDDPPPAFGCYQVNRLSETSRADDDDDPPPAFGWLGS
jgi:hypothetical protein